MRLVVFFIVFAFILFIAGNVLFIESYLLYHFFAVMLATAGLTKLGIIYAKKFGIIDTPSVRKIHKYPTPSIGGMVFIPIALISWLIKMSDSIDEKTVVIHSWNKTCVTCAEQVEILKQAEQDFKDVIFLSFEQTKDKKIAKFLEIDYWTTIVIYKDNKELSRTIGQTDKDKIYSQIKSLK